MDNGSTDIQTPEIDPTKMDNMVQLDELSEADMRHDRCPGCQYNPLRRDEGFKLCPRCQTIYKMVDGKGYMVVTKETDPKSEEKVLPADQKVTDQNVMPKDQLYMEGNKISRLRKIAQK